MAVVVAYIYHPPVFLFHFKFGFVTCESYDMKDEINWNNTEILLRMKVNLIIDQSVN